MTRCLPGSGEPEVLAFGGEGGSRTPAVRTAAGAVVCLALVGVFGVELNHGLGAPPEVESSPVVLVAGEVHDLQRCHDDCLRLPIFNAGDTTVRVTGVGFDARPHRALAKGPAIAPQTWSSVRFDVPVHCDRSAPGVALLAHLRVTSAGVPRQRTVRLPRATSLLTERHHRSCPSGRPAVAADIAGSWLVEGVHGVWRGLRGRQLMHFAADGRFRWDLAGHLSGPYRAVRGRYVLADGTLTVTARRPDLCHVGDVYTWRTTMTGADRMHLGHLRDSDGGCGPPLPAVSVTRRVEVHHHGLVPPLPDPRSGAAGRRLAPDLTNDPAVTRPAVARWTWGWSTEGRAS